MNQQGWQRLGLMAVVISGLAAGGVWADAPDAASGAVIVLREPGKPERKCVIERTTPQADGTFLHEVRDAATGERLRVRDSRRHNGLVGKPLARVSGTEPASMAKDTSWIATKPAESRSLPTNAELASYATPSVMPSDVSTRGGMVWYRTKPATTLSPVQRQVQKLKDAEFPSEREVAAMTLALSDARATPEVIDALVTAAQTDQAASVRVCLVRCLYRLSTESPQVVPVIQALQADADDEVSRTAQLAMQEVGKVK